MSTEIDLTPFDMSAVTDSSVSVVLNITREWSRRRGSLSATRRHSECTCSALVDGNFDESRAVTIGLKCSHKNQDGVDNAEHKASFCWVEDFIVMRK